MLPPVTLVVLKSSALTSLMLPPLILAVPVP